MQTLVQRVSERTGNHVRMPEFVFLTAYVSQGLIKHAQERGVAQIYEKPLQDEQIREIIAKV